jgi:hypothetical protein
VIADESLGVFDGYSIGSNDLTQLVLELDRDSGTVAHLFDERNAAVKPMLRQAIAAAKRMGKPIGICGQAPSDYPDMAEWLVECGIDSISLNPDTAIKTAFVIPGPKLGTNARRPLGSMRLSNASRGTGPPRRVRHMRPERSRPLLRTMGTDPRWRPRPEASWADPTERTLTSCAGRPRESSRGDH